MAKSYKVTPMVRIVNRLMTFMNGRGLGGGDTYILTTLGNKSGLERSTPVTPATLDGARYLVAPYGEVGWVHNLRAAGQATLSHGGNEEEIEAEEVLASEAGPVLRQYVKDVKIVRPYFDAQPDDPVADFVGEAHAHPVFRIR